MCKGKLSKALCMFVLVYVCIHICIHNVYIYIHKYIGVHTLRYIYIYTHIVRFGE